MLGLILSLFFAFPAQAQEEQSVLDSQVVPAVEVQDQAGEEVRIVRKETSPPPKRVVKKRAAKAKKKVRAAPRYHQKEKAVIAPPVAVEKKAVAEKAPTAANPFAPVPPTPFEPSNP